MIKFKGKSYSAVTKGGQSAWQMVKEGAIKGAANPLAWIGAAGSAAGIANYMSNRKRLKQADVQHAQVMKQNERLIRALGGVEKGLSSIPQPVQQPQPIKDDSWLRVGGRKIFSEKKEKSYGMVFDSTWKGGAIGAGLSGALSMFLPKGVNNKAVAFLGAALGALAGSVWGSVKTINQKSSQMDTGHKFIREVIKNLERAGYKRGSDWTADPKQATQIRTKVCVVLSRRADELGILVNSVNEPELKKITDSIQSSLPSGSQRTDKYSDRFNEVQVTSVPTPKDAVYVFSIIEKFIKAGYPVQLMEV